MPYYAELDGISGLALCGSALSLPPDFEIDYDLFILANGSEDYFSAPFNGRGIGFWSSFVAFYASTQQVYFSYPSTGRPVINDRVNIRFTSTDNGDSTFTIRCYMSVNGGAEEQLNRAVGNDVFSTPLSARPMEWGRRPSTVFRKVGVVRTRYYESGILQNDWDFNQSSGSTAPDLVGSNPATLSGGFSWAFYDDGGGGVLSIDPSGISTQETFGDLALEIGGVFLGVVGVSSQEAIGALTLDTAGVNIQPEAVVSEDGIGGLEVIPLGVSISADTVGSSETVNQPSVDIGLIVVDPDSVASEEVVPNPTLEKLLTVLIVPNLSDTFSVGRPIVLGGDRIVIPVVSRTNFTEMQRYLTTLGFKGALEDVILTWLRSEGYEGQWNDAWYAYLEAEGLEGSLTDKRSKWRNE